MEWKSVEDKPNRVDIYPVIVLADEDRGGYAREWVSYDGNIFLTHRKVLLWLDAPLLPLPCQTWLEWLFTSEDEMNNEMEQKIPRCKDGGVCGIGGFCADCYLKETE